MQVRTAGDRPHRRFVLVLDPGEEVVAALKRFAREHGVKGARVSGIGAFSRSVLAFFDLASKAYEENPVEEQAEVASLEGNLGVHGGEIKVHLHAVLGRRDGAALAGHLREGHVRPTLELFVAETQQPLLRRKDEETGLPLLGLRLT